MTSGVSFFVLGEHLTIGQVRGCRVDYRAHATDNAAEEEERQPWEMRSDESAEAFKAFCDYRGMGKASLNALYLRYRSGTSEGPPPTRRMRTLSEWCARYDWVERRKAWRRFLADIQAEETMRSVREMAQRQAADAQQFQALAVKLLHYLGGWDEDAGQFKLREDAEYRFQDAVRMFKVGFEAERVARGEAASIVEERGARKDLSELSEAELAKMADDP